MVGNHHPLFGGATFDFLMYRSIALSNFDMDFCLLECWKSIQRRIAEQEIISRRTAVH